MQWWIRKWKLSAGSGISVFVCVCREVRECLKLDPDHKQCFSHYKQVKKLNKQIQSAEELIQQEKYDSLNIYMTWATFDFVFALLKNCNAIKIIVLHCNNCRKMILVLIEADITDVLLYFNFICKYIWMNIIFTSFKWAHFWGKISDFATQN